MARNLHHVVTTYNDGYIGMHRSIHTSWDTS